MTIRTNIKDVFDYLGRIGFDIKLGESCCSGPLASHEYCSQNGWIRATTESDYKMMEDINEEGSAEVTWEFGPEEKIASMASSIVSAFTKKGYIVEWNKRMRGKITAIIEIDDLPTSFLNKWIGTNPEEEEDEEYFIEERVDPDVDVVFNKEDEDAPIFSSDENDSDEDDTDEDNKSEPIIDPSEDESDDESEDESDDETMCPKGCMCVNCKEESDE
uniref:Uncharacterized protein n=1 Tax=viral metagenome TaxID=1070528 RepID=A0A6C0H2V6_9ZZZZ